MASTDKSDHPPCRGRCGRHRRSAWRHSESAGEPLVSVPPTSAPTMYRPRESLITICINYRFATTKVKPIEGSVPSASAYRKRIDSAPCASSRGSVPQILQHRPTLQTQCKPSSFAYEVCRPFFNLASNSTCAEGLPTRPAASAMRTITELQA